MLELAGRLRELPRDDLAAALRSREFDASGVNDLFDLAETLLAPDSVDRAIARLDRPGLAVLAAAADPGATLEGVRRTLAELGAPASTVDAAGPIIDRLAESLLVVRTGEQVHVPAGVVARLVPRLGVDLPTAAELAAPAPPVLVGGDPVDRSLLERRSSDAAYATVAATAELLAALGAQPARELAKGGLALPDSKRLAEASGTPLEALPRLFHRADEAGLVVRDGAYWLESDRGAAWSMQPARGRWLLLASCWRDRIPETLRDLVTRRSEPLTSGALRDDVRWLYPAGGAWLEDGLERLLHEAEALGLAVSGEPVDTARLVLAGELDRAADVIAAHFPTQVDRVYLQHDLSIVAPGPLEPELDARLRGIADVEARDLASTYRVSAASVNRALASGERAESILEFLSSISLTGIPQPLAYLVSEAAERFGAVRVSAAAESEAPALASIRSDDAELIGTLAVDQALASLALRRTGPHRLLTRFAPDVVFWALSDAKYPVAAEDAAGEIVRLQRHRLAPAPVVAARADPVAALLDRLEATQGGDGTEQAWLARQLEAAARSKEVLTVTVRMPGGDTADYLLAPASVANGRLRARDHKADIERTLPLSAIAAVAPAPVAEA